MKINVSRETICLTLTPYFVPTHGGTAQGPFPTHDYSAICLALWVRDQREIKSIFVLTDGLLLLLLPGLAYLLL